MRQKGFFCIFAHWNTVDRYGNHFIHECSESTETKSDAIVGHVKNSLTLGKSWKKTTSFILSNKFSGKENFISQRCKMIVTNGKWNEHKFDMKKFQSLDVVALVCGEPAVCEKYHKHFSMKIDKFWWMKVRFTSVGEKFL
jgi:hypothetical protein